MLLCACCHGVGGFLFSVLGVCCYDGVVVLLVLCLFVYLQVAMVG